MMLRTTSDSQKVQVRLARYYLNKLRTASVSIQRGHAGIASGLHLFDQEWEQIEHWQAHAAERRGEDKGWLSLCQEYPLAGLEVLSIRQNLADQARWLESGLEAAIQLEDARAELIILHKLGAVYALLGAVEKSAYYAESLLKRGQEAQDRLFIGRGYFAMGSVAEDRGSYSEALVHIQLALDIFIHLDARKDKSHALYSLGSIALYLADFDKAYDYFSQHLELAESEGDMSEVCRGLLSVAQVLIILEAYTQAEPYIRRAIQISRQLGFQRLLGAGLIMLAQWFGEQDQIELELKYYAEGIAAARAAGSQRDVIHGLSNSGLARLFKGDLEGALRDLQEGLEVAQLAGIPRFTCNLQRNIADTYLALNDLEAARPALKEALRLACEMGSIYPMVKALTSAIGYWQLKGWNEQAALWAGNIMNRPEVDHNLFEPICARLEAALGTEAYRQAIEKGRGLELEAILAEIAANLP